MAIQNVPQFLRSCKYRASTVTFIIFCQCPRHLTWCLSSVLSPLYNVLICASLYMIEQWNKQRSAALTRDSRPSDHPAEPIINISQRSEWGIPHMQGSFPFWFWDLCTPWNSVFSSPIVSSQNVLHSILLTCACSHTDFDTPGTKINNVDLNPTSLAQAIAERCADSNKWYPSTRESMERELWLPDTTSIIN